MEIELRAYLSWDDRGDLSNTYRLLGVWWSFDKIRDNTEREIVPEKKIPNMVLSRYAKFECHMGRDFWKYRSRIQNKD